MRHFKELLSLSEGEAVTEKQLQRILVSSVCSILLCISCLAGSTWAWFATSVTGESQIQAGIVELEVKAGDTVLQPGSQLSTGEYQITFTNKGSVEGYGEITLNGSSETKVYKTKILSPNSQETITVTFEINEECTVELRSSWNRQEKQLLMASGTPEEVILLQNGETYVFGDAGRKVTLVACIDGIADKQIQVNAEEVAAFVLPDCPAEFVAPEGKQFKGWALTNGGEVLTEITLDADKTLYAVWEDIPVTYTVTFDPSGAAGTMEPAKVQGTFTLPACAFTAPEGKQFQGWSLAVNGELCGETIHVEADTTVYAVWMDQVPAAEDQNQTTEYTITFEFANGTEQDTVVTEGGKVQLPEPSYDGHTFSGWQDASGTAVTADTVFTADTTLTAVWTEVQPEPETKPQTEPVTYVVSYVQTEGAEPLKTDTLSAGTSITLSAELADSVEGMVLHGWKIGETPYDIGAQYVVNGDVTIVAVWSSAPAAAVETEPVETTQPQETTIAAEETTTTQE